MTEIDRRICELQDRLHRKRLLNQQLANQITAASNKAAAAAAGQHHLRYKYPILPTPKKKQKNLRSNQMLATTLEGGKS